MDARRKNVRKFGIDFTILCCVAVPLLFFWLLGVPFHRGFFCNDDSIRHPYRGNTVENWMLGLIATLLPFLVFAITEIVKAHASNTVCTSGSRYPQWLVECYKHIGCLLYCEACTLLLTFIGKYSIGRLRPHFYSVCLPRMPDGTTCNDPINHNRYIEEFVCQNSDTTAFQLLDMRQSFPSGHASLAASAMVFCAMYLQARMTWSGSYLGRHFFQFMLIALAIFTGLSRVSDYMHHWSDVLTGFILGTVVAVIVALYVSDMLKEKTEELQFVMPQIRTDSQNERILSDQSNNNNNNGAAVRIMS